MSPLCDSGSTYSLHLLHHWNLHQTLCCYLCAVFGPSSRPPASRAPARFSHATPDHHAQHLVPTSDRFWDRPSCAGRRAFPCPYGLSQIVINLYRRR
jgi:hypothetical protein